MCKWIPLCTYIVYLKQYLCPPLHLTHSCHAPLERQVHAPNFHPQPCFMFAFPDSFCSQGNKDWKDKGLTQVHSSWAGPQAQCWHALGSSLPRACIHCKESKSPSGPTAPGPSPLLPGSSRSKIVSCISVMVIRNVPVKRTECRISGHCLHPHLTSHPGLLFSVGSRKGNLIWKNPAGPSNKVPHLTCTATL